MEDTALAQLAADKVVLGRQLMGNLKDLLHIEGVRRIEQQIRRETENLQVVRLFTFVNPLNESLE